MNQNDNKKRCWICKRIIVGSSILGLCPDCIDKGGSTVATIGGIGLTVFGGLFFKDHKPFKKG